MCEYLCWLSAYLCAHKQQICVGASLLLKETEFLDLDLVPLLTG